MADDEFSITALVTAAGGGDQIAWNDIVDRFSPLLVGVLRQCRLTAAETEDVAQTVWLRLVEHLDSLREARALPTWIVTTGRREFSRAIPLISIGSASRRRRRQRMTYCCAPSGSKPCSQASPSSTPVTASSC